VDACDEEAESPVTHDTVSQPSYLLGQATPAMLDSWLKEDIQPGGEGPVVKAIPEGLQLLVPMMFDGEGVLSLCEQLRGTKGASVVALVADEDAGKAFLTTSSLVFTVDTLRYEPPWYQDASKLEHLTSPVPVYKCAGGATHAPLTVYVSSLLEPSFGVHTGRLMGSFHRVWDQGQLAHTPPAQRAKLLKAIRSYTTAPAQLLVSCSVHVPGEVASSLPGIAYSLPLAEMRDLCGSSSAVHCAKQVKRNGAPLSWLGLASQQGCVYWIWLLKDSEAAEGSSFLRPPCCPCCK